MIGKVTRGTRVPGLPRYLFGPGRHNEHTDPHLVAGWDAPSVLEPLRDGNGSAVTGPLALLLEQPLDAAVGRLERKPVWQCSVRAAPTDRRLSDDEWATIARDVVAHCGFAPEGDDAGCRWVAVRHADDHIHLVVTLARQDGRVVHPHNDYYRLGEACRAAERHLELVITPARDRTAPTRPTRGEQEKAARWGLPEPAQMTLRRHVRSAAGSATGVEDFLERLRNRGLLVKERLSTTVPGDITGYAVALPGMTSADGEPIYYGGAKLAADLSLRKLQRRWIAADSPASATPRLDPAQRAAVWAQAQRVTAHAAEEINRLAGIDPAAAADAAWAASDALTVAARVIDGDRPGPLTRAADTYDRAARDLWGRTPPRHPTGAALRGVARALAMTGRARRDEAAQMMSLVINLTALCQAVAQLRESQDRAAQAAAARAAAEQLRCVTAGARTTQHSATRTPGVRPTPTRGHRRSR